MKLSSFARRCLQRNFSVESQRSLDMIDLEYLKPEVVLSENNRTSFIKKFKSRKVLEDSDGNTNRAAVLIPLCKHNGELGFLYTLRSTKLNNNRGQVSFPGGMYDKNDDNLQETALRETWEELQIPGKMVDVWASGNMIDKKNMKVLPVFGYIGEIEPEKLQVNSDEVEEAFFISLKKLCDPSQFRFTQFRNSYVLPVYMGGKHRVWGFTAAVTHMVLNTLIPRIYKHKLVYLRSVVPQLKCKHKDAPSP